MNRLRFSIGVSVCLWLGSFGGANCLVVAQQPSTPAAPKVAAFVENDAANWKEFKSDEGRFLILFPGKPQTSVQTTEASGITFTLHLTQLTTFAEYSVMYADYPESINDRNPEVAKAVLDDGLAGAVAEVHSELLAVEEISIAGHPGRLYSERMPGGEILRAKSFLVGNRMYQIAITTPKEAGASAESVRFYQTTANKFLASFRLVDKTSN